MERTDSYLGYILGGSFFGSWLGKANELLTFIIGILTVIVLVLQVIKYFKNKWGNNEKNIIYYPIVICRIASARS